MTFNQSLEKEGLAPEVAGIGILDARFRRALMKRAPKNKKEARLQGALSGSLLLFAQFNDLLIWLSPPSQAFFIDSPTVCDITFFPDRAFAHAPPYAWPWLRERWSSFADFARDDDEQSPAAPEQRVLRALADDEILADPIFRQAFDIASRDPDLFDDVYDWNERLLALPYDEDPARLIVTMAEDLIAKHSGGIQ
jgi:hypothetical protein